MFGRELEKPVFYHLSDFLYRIIGSEKNFIANASNFSSMIFHNLEGVNWAGFYFASGQDLVLGPFQGKTACVRIPIDNGVCGASFRKKIPILVSDVHNFPGYIPCDPSANSELVVPVLYKNDVIGVFDLDSPRFNRFSSQDVEIINELLSILISSSEVEPLLVYYGR